MRRIGFALVALLLLTVPAQATGLEPFLGGLIAGLSGTAAIDLVGGLYGIGAAIGGFLAGTGGLLLLAGLNVAIQLLSAQPQNRPKTDAVRYNVRIEAGMRRDALGKNVRIGGNAIFGEHDDNGNFWYIIYHCDTEMMSTPSYLFDDKPVTVNGSNRVTTAEFTIDQSDGGTPYLSVWTVTFAHDDPVPSLPSAFTSAFSTIWTSDHKLAGTTVSIIKFDALSIETRNKLPFWRGPFGIGEPWVSVLADFGRFADPREVGYDAEDASTWVSSASPPIIWAGLRMLRYGNVLSDFDWDRITYEADLCDAAVLDKYAQSAPRYTCGIAIENDMQNAAAELEVLKTCDGMVITSDAGLLALDVGWWEEPEVEFTDQRDILALSGGAVDDGEQPMDGCVVYYSEPEYNNQRHPCSPWINTDYYVEGRQPNFKEIDVLGCQSHNQAVRLAKALGQRAQSKRHYQPTTGLKALLLNDKRNLTMTLGGISVSYEINAPVEIDPSGLGGLFSCVPVDQNRWQLLTDEEGDKPPASMSYTPDSGLTAASNMLIVSQPIEGSGGASVQLYATWDALERIDREEEIQYRVDGETTWLDFPVLDQDNRIGQTGPLTDGETYNTRYRTVTATGRAGDWADGPNVTAIADTSPPDSVSGVSVTPGAGDAQFDWTAPASGNYFAARIYTNVSNDFGAATLSAIEYGAVGVADSKTVSLAAGTWYAWIVAINGSGIEATEVATGSFTVS